MRSHNTADLNDTRPDTKTRNGNFDHNAEWKEMHRDSKDGIFYSDDIDVSCNRDCWSS